MSHAHRRFGIATVLAIALLCSAVVGGAAYWLGHRASERDAGAGAEAQRAPQVRYHCPMHPSIIQDHPGTCPICGMDLIPVDPVGESPREAEGGRGGAPAVEGRAIVDIDPARQQLIGLTTAPVTVGPVGGAWRTFGRVAVDETRVRHINVKVPGFIERIHVDYVGKSVREGDPLFAVYSPELLSAQEEYLLALRTRGALGRGGALADDGEALVRSARRKLSLWDVPESEIERLEQTGETSKTLTFYSPVSGVVTKKDIVEGMKLEAGAMPYEIVDLSSVWVLADIYEGELQHVKVGMPASLTLNAFPNHEFKGRVLFMDPLLDPQTRTVKVRLAFPNPSGDLRPEMFGEVVLHGEPREGLRIPQDAVLDSGTEKIVFVSLGHGKFEPRKVRLGLVNGHDVEVVSGLALGEQVVTRANFLIDSESKLRASLAEVSTAAGSAPGAPAPPPASHEGHRP